MGLTKKQREVYNSFKKECLLNNGKVWQFHFIGGTGSGKTFYNLALFHLLCVAFRGCRFGVVRKSEAVLKKNTIPSFRKVLDTFGLDRKRVPVVDMIARYENGSEIIFQWADVSKDPDCLNIKGSEFTALLFEEIDQLDHKVFTTGQTRIGRNNNVISEATGKPFYIPPFITSSCNPNATWFKRDIYDKHTEGMLEDHIRVFESIPQDNLKHLGQNYINVLESLPEQERQRYLFNNWDYSDDPSLLIQYAWIKECRDRKYEEFELSGRIVMAIDPADDGSDATVYTFMKGNTVFRIEEFPNLDQNSAALKAIEYHKEYKMDNDYSVIVDSVGIGAGTANRMIEAGIKVAKFKGGERAQSKTKLFTFKNRRAESAWFLRESFTEGDIVTYQHSQLETELTNIHYTSDDKQIILEDKKKIRPRLGKSPDYFDSLVMCNYLRLGFCRPIKRRVGAVCV